MPCDEIVGQKSIVLPAPTCRKQANQSGGARSKDGERTSKLALLSAMASRSTVTISAARLSGRMPGAMPRHPISHAAMHAARPSLVAVVTILGRRVNAPEPETQTLSGAPKTKTAFCAHFKLAGAMPGQSGSGLSHQAQAPVPVHSFQFRACGFKEGPGQGRAGLQGRSGLNY
jgi:hypothetical protein